MNTQSPMTSSSPADPPLKRKRGRPRKDENLVQPEPIPATPVVDSSKRNKQCEETTADENEMVGQAVSGVIEGSFVDGYLLKVKIGDHETHLRGVVFLPGACAPLTPSNDVAPEITMCKRTDMPIPDQSPLASEQCDKQATEAQNFMPMLDARVEGLTSEVQPYIPSPPENQQVAAVLPLTDNLPPMSSVTSSFGGGQQFLESGLGSSSALPQMVPEKVAEHDDLLKEFEASLTKAAAATEQPKSTPPPEPPIDRSPERTVNLELHIQHQAADDDLKLESQPEDEVKTQNIEHNQSLMSSAETLGIATWIEKPDSPPKPALSEPQNTGIPDTSKENGSVRKPESPAANSPETEPTSAPITSLPVTLFEREPMPSSPKPSTEGSILQMMIQPQLCISTGTEDIMKLNVDSAPVTSLNVNLFERSEQPPSETKVVDSVPVTSMNVNLFERSDQPPSESKLVSDKPETQPQFCSSST
ncbi:Protein METABOLIC NETWORK MODULATOR 1 [Euphorbia peplus]|nr:Protein METABOLIC NETWORK MODULATOR 1 [Euphorbia peplus]